MIGVVAGRVVVGDEDPLLAAGGDAEDRVVERLRVDVDAAGDERVERRDVVGEERQLDVDGRPPRRCPAPRRRRAGTSPARRCSRPCSVAPSPPAGGGRLRSALAADVAAGATGGRGRRLRRRAGVVVVATARRGRPVASASAGTTAHAPSTCVHPGPPDRARRRRCPAEATVRSARFGFVSCSRTADATFEAPSKGEPSESSSGADAARPRRAAAVADRASRGSASSPPTDSSAIAAPMATGSRSGRVSWRNQFCTASSLDISVSAARRGVHRRGATRRRCPPG